MAAPDWLNDPALMDQVAKRAHDEWERDLCAALMYEVFGVGVAPATPMDYSAHPIFAVLHARWLARRPRPEPVKEDRQ